MSIRSKIWVPMIAIAPVTALATWGTDTVIFSGDMDADSEAAVRGPSGGRGESPVRDVRVRKVKCACELR